MAVLVDYLGRRVIRKEGGRPRAQVEFPKSNASSRKRHGSSHVLHALELMTRDKTNQRFIQSHVRDLMPCDKTNSQ